MNITRRTLGLAAMLGAMGVVAGPAAAETAAEFYKGKTITAISPAGPESTFTVYAQLMAPFIEKYSGARVVVQPIPEGGGYSARNKMFAADPDGLTIVLVGHGAKLITGAMFELDGVHYDWTKFTPLARVVDESLLVFVAADSPWMTPADAAKDTFNYGESSVFFGPQVAEALGWEHMSVIPGFRSTADRATAIARGEIQATAASKEVVVSYPDSVKLLAASSKQPDFPDVPTFYESASTDHGRKYAKLIEAWVGLLNLSYAPPGLSEEKAAFLEDVLKKTWADPEFAKSLEKVKALPTQGEFMGRAKLKQYMDEVAGLSAGEVAELKDIVTDKYKKK